MRRSLAVALAAVMVTGTLELFASDKEPRDRDRSENRADQQQTRCAEPDRAPASVVDKVIGFALNPYAAAVRVTLAASKTAEKEHDIYDHTQGEGGRSKNAGTKESGGLSERTREKMTNPKQ